MLETTNERNNKKTYKHIKSHSFVICNMYFNNSLIICVISYIFFYVQRMVECIYSTKWILNVRSLLEMRKGWRRWWHEGVAMKTHSRKTPKLIFNFTLINNYTKNSFRVFLSYKYLHKTIWCLNPGYSCRWFYHAVMLDSVEWKLEWNEESHGNGKMLELHAAARVLSRILCFLHPKRVKLPLNKAHKHTIHIYTISYHTTTIILDLYILVLLTRSSFSFIHVRPLFVRLRAF